MQDWQQRVIGEKDQLDDRIEKLESFLSSTQVDNVEENALELLQRQLTVMQEYSAILGERIDSW
jgi:hypothetical protein